MSAIKQFIYIFLTKNPEMSSGIGYSVAAADQTQIKYSYISWIFTIKTHLSLDGDWIEGAYPGLTVLPGIVLLLGLLNIGRLALPSLCCLFKDCYCRAEALWCSFGFFRQIRGCCLLLMNLWTPWCKCHLCSSVLLCVDILISVVVLVLSKHICL